MIGYVPQAGMINALVLGIADAHLAEVPEQELYAGLSHVINLITYWRDGGTMKEYTLVPTTEDEVRQVPD